MRLAFVVAAMVALGCGDAPFPEQGEDALVRFGPVTEGDEDLPLYVIHGEQWVWTVELPNGLLEHELVLTVGEPVRIEIRSEDVAHRWVLDGTSLRIDVPAHGSVTRRVEPLAPANLATRCEVSCGAAGASFRMDVRVITTAEAARARMPCPGPDETPLGGRLLFGRLGCATCHPSPGGDLRGLAGRTRTFEDGTSLVLDDASLDDYLERSIRDPDAQRVVGHEDLRMSRYRLGDGPIRALVAYTRCLARGCEGHPECADACDEQ